LGGLRSFWRHLKATIIAGVLVVTPLVVTYLVVRLVFNFLRDLVGPLTSLKLFEFVPQHAFTWVALGLTVMIVYLAGLVTKHALAGRLMTLGHHVAEAIPGVGTVYSMARRATEVLASTSNRERHCNRVVIVDFPRRGLKTIGLVTRRFRNVADRPLLMLYIPTAPNPTSGFTALVPEEEVIGTDLSMEDAMKLVVSGGVVFPDDMGRYVFNEHVATPEVTTEVMQPDEASPLGS